MKSKLLIQPPSSGILLPIFSLPSPYGIGDLGPSAYQFVDFLWEAEQRFWQVLPIFQTTGANPYVPLSTFAGNTLLISPELLVEERLLDHPPSPLGHGRIDYEKVRAYKEEIYRKAFKNFRPNQEYEEFCAENIWLEDFATFSVLCRIFRAPWNKWPVRPGEQAREYVKERWREETEFEKFLQYLFFKQWAKLREVCNSREIQLMGDLPFYLPHQAVEVWLHPELFKLDQQGNPLYLSGVPPDFFSNVGQFWGTPVYNWEEHRKQRFSWWIERLKHVLKLFDWVRLDHFRGFIRYWEVPAGERLEKGRWVVAGGADFFLEIERNLGSSVPLFAEDLGALIPEEIGIIDALGIPTIRVLLFALTQDQVSGRHAPHEYPENCIAYTSTHDSPTVRGWFESAGPKQRNGFFRYLGREVDAGEVHLECLKLLLASNARLCIFPLQDVLGLGNEARINTPGTSQGNWEWRVLPQQVSSEIAKNLRKLTVNFGRA